MLKLSIATSKMVTEPNQIKPALQKAFDSGIPAVLDVRINPDVETILDYLWASSYNPATYVDRLSCKE